MNHPKQLYILYQRQPIAEGMTVVAFEMGIRVLNFWVSMVRLYNQPFIVTETLLLLSMQLKRINFHGHTQILTYV